MTKFSSRMKLGGYLLAVLCMAASAWIPADRAHAANVASLTTVGQLSAAQKPAGVPDDYVVTPNGYFAASCVVAIHQGDKLQAGGMIERASGALEKPATCTQPNYTLQGDRIEPNGQHVTVLGRHAPPPVQSGWVQDANYASSTPIGRIVATWTVPSQPSKRGSQVIYFFPGLEQLPNVQSILQPVLGWNGYGDKAWTLASWNCCVNGTTFHSDPIAAHAGDVVVGDTYSNCAPGVACSSWNIDSRNTTTGQTTTLTTNPYADLTWVFGGVLEVYSVATCNQYPGGPMTFSNVQVYDRNNNHVSNPPWQGANTSGITPQCGYGLQTTASTVTISY